MAAAISPVAAQSQRRAGDALSVALPLATLGTELLRGDRDGAGQYALTFATATLGTEALKRLTHVERPDRSNELSFPSGHAARAFSVAAYVRQRHGGAVAAVLYAAALYVGHTRVSARRHRWADVAGAALVAEASAAWWVRPAADKAVSVSAAVGPGSIAVRVRAAW